MAPETLSDYWKQTALDLISQRHLDWTSPGDLAVWVGRASAVLAEAMRASGDNRGVDELMAPFKETAARTEIKANADA